jgi:hypothetical protein
VVGGPRGPSADGEATNHVRDGAELLRLHEQAPLARTEVMVGQVPMPAWLVTRYEDIRTVLSDTARFSSSGRSLFDREVRAAVPRCPSGALSLQD